MTKPSELPPILVDTDTVSRWLNVTGQTLRTVAKTGKYFTIPDKGQWDLEKTTNGFVRYLREQNERDRDKKKEFDAERVRKLKLANDETEGELVRIETLMETAAPTLQKIKEIIYSKLNDEMPIAVAGMDVPQSRIYGTRLAGEIIKLCSELFKKWGI
jgi:hypothetical protein